MATFVLIHGAADTAWYWHLLEPELRERRPRCRDDGPTVRRRLSRTGGVRRRGGRRLQRPQDLVLVAQSFGGFTAPLICERVPVDLMVLQPPRRRDHRRHLG